jgi:DNA polymerase-3 subunit epsilon
VIRRKAVEKNEEWADYFRRQADSCRDPQLKQYYAAGLPDAATPLGDVPFVAMDFETTGMNPQRHAIVSIGLVPFTLERIRPADGNYWVVRPQEGLVQSSVEIHGITDSEVAAAPDLDRVLPELLVALEGHVPVVHFLGIERPFLDTAVMARRGEHCLFPLIDTMAIEARFRQQDWWETIRGWLGLSRMSIRLAASRERYGLPIYGQHHAKVDALATAELFQAQVRHHFSPDKPVGELWL